MSNNEDGKFYPIKDLIIFLPILIAYIIVGALASHPYDDAIYANNAKLFYYLRIPPFFSLPMGAYYDAVNISGYFFSVFLSLFHITNVITIQLGVKIPFIIFAFLTAFIVMRIGRELGFNGKFASLLLLTSPIYFFTALIYGSAIVVSVFFLMAGLLFLIRKKIPYSAILYGMSIGSYLYPVFAVPFIFRYIWIREGRKNALTFFIISSIFAALGQLSILFFFFSKGMAGAAPSSPSGYLSPWNYVTYYSPLDFLNIFNLGSYIPGETLNILYYGSAIIASFAYFLIPRDKVDIRSLVVFLFIQGILFSSLAPYDLPSYITAEIPLAIVFSFMERRWIFIALTWMSSFFSFIVMQTINNVGFVIYFADLNHSILNLRNSYPSWVVQAAGSLYGISILSSLFFLRKKRGRENFIPKKSLAAQSSIILALVVVAIILLVPVVSNITPDMMLSSELNTFTPQVAGESIVNGNLMVEYSFPMSLYSGNYAKNHMTGIISLPSFPVPVFMQLAGRDNTSGNMEYNISVPFSIYNPAITLYYPSDNMDDLFLENGSGIIHPSSISFIAGNPNAFRYSFSGEFAGKYSLRIDGQNAFYSNGKVPTMSFAGFPYASSITLDGHNIKSYIPVKIIEPRMVVIYHGPYMEIPQILPTFSITLNLPTEPYAPYLITGGIMFLSLILIPLVIIRRW